MARRSNFSFERSQRERDKAAKREAKRAARAARKGGADAASPPSHAAPERAPTVIPGQLASDENTLHREGPLVS